MKFVNYSVIDHELLNKIIYDVGKSYKEPITPCEVILLPPTKLEVISLGHIYSLPMPETQTFPYLVEFRICHFSRFGDF